MGQIERAAKTATNWWVERLMTGNKQKFAEILQPLIEADLREHGRCVLECDYDPQRHLLTAVREAVDPKSLGFIASARGILPFKHCLDVTLTVLYPKEGYGNWTDDIIVPGEPEG